MRLLMMGTGPFAVPTFESLLDSQHQVVALVTRPLPPAKGRRKGSANPMRDVAQQRDLEIREPADVNSAEAHQMLAAFAPELLVVCDYGQILSNETLRIAPLGGINLHASLLPKYRGAAPINWAIWEGCRETGVTVIHMTPKLDGGPCLVQRCTPISPQEDAVALEQRLACEGVDAVQQAIAMLASWDHQALLGIRQDPARATRAPRLRKDQGRVDWAQPAAKIADQVRALKPWPGTFTNWLHEASAPMRLILDAVSVVPESSSIQAECGQVVAIDKHRLVVATGDGLLSVDRVQPAGKRAMAIDEFLRGHRVQPGDRLGS